MAAPGSSARTGDLPSGPGLAHRWWVALPCLVGGTLLPVALADAVVVWHNRVSRSGVTLSRVIADFAPAVALWSGVALLAGLVAALVTRRGVTAWPRIAALVAAPSLVAMAVVGVVSGLGSHLPFLLDVPLAASLGAGGFLLVRLGVRRLVEHPGADTLDTGLDVRVDLSGTDHLVLRADRLVVVEGSEAWAVSWYDFRTLRVGPAGVEIQANGGRRRTVRVDDASSVVAAVRQRVRWVRRHPRFAERRDRYRRAHGTRGAEAYRRGSRPRTSHAPGTGLGPAGLLVLFMTVMPLAAVVLLVAAVNASSADRPSMVIGVVASLVIGAWAHARFWRRRAARRYLTAHTDDGRRS
jgi:hypothetical protein